MSQNQIMQSMWQTGVADGRCVFLGKVPFQIFTQNWLLGIHCLFITLHVNTDYMQSVKLGNEYKKVQNSPTIRKKH